MTLPEIDITEYRFQWHEPARLAQRNYPRRNLLGVSYREILPHPDKGWVLRWSFRPHTDEEMAAYLREKRGLDQPKATRLDKGTASRKHWAARTNIQALAKISGEEPHWHGPTEDTAVYHSHAGVYHDVPAGRDRLEHREVEE
jgi:hypothetical protein